MKKINYNLNLAEMSEEDFVKWFNKKPREGDPVKIYKSLKPKKKTDK